MPNPSSTQAAESSEVLSQRIQQSLQEILARLDGRDALSEAELGHLRRELRMLVMVERLQITT
jgi:hypothetical protein